MGSTSPPAKPGCRSSVASIVTGCTSPPTEACSQYAEGLVVGFTYPVDADEPTTNGPGSGLTYAVGLVGDTYPPAGFTGSA